MELLTVISILATLAALLYPVYLKVRSRVYEVRCADQLRQIGLAIRMYAQDQGDGTPYSLVYILGRLYPYYIRDKEILVCPYFNACFPGIAKEAYQISQKNPQRALEFLFSNNPKGVRCRGEKRLCSEFQRSFCPKGRSDPYCLLQHSSVWLP